MKKITLAKLFGILLVFTINVNASTTLSRIDTPAINSFGLGVDTIYSGNRIGVAEGLDAGIFSVEPAVSSSITIGGNSDFEDAGIKLAANPMPAFVWLLGSAAFGIGVLVSRRKSLPG